MTDTITNRRLTPKRAVIIYSNNNNSDFYLENRDLVNKGGTYHFAAPVPLSDDVMKEVAKSYLQKNASDMEFGSFIPGHLLHASNRPGSTIVVWYRTAGMRSLNISVATAKEKALNVMLPATLYAVVNSNLYIYALMTDERPSPKTKLYKAPFFNVYNDGRVCLGTARVGKHKAKTFEGEAERFEKGFYLAEQSGGTFATQCKTPLRELWKKLAGKKTPFPSKLELVLHPTHKTVADLFHNILKVNLPSNG